MATAPTPSPATSSPPRERQRTFAVLVIDDSPIEREITGRHLSKAWPFEHDLLIEYAASGHEAMEHMRRKRFAFIVLDWRLPGMGGGDVLRQIRQQGVHIPVIVISGLERAAIPDDLTALSAAFLNKDEMTPVTFHTAIGESLKLLNLTQPARE